MASLLVDGLETSFTRGDSGAGRSLFLRAVVELRLTLLAPEIEKAILEVRQTETLTLAMLMKPFPVEWQQQQRVWSAKP